MVESYSAIGLIALIGEPPVRINPWNRHGRTLRLSSALSQTIVGAHKDVRADKICRPKARSLYPLPPPRTGWGHASGRSHPTASEPDSLAVARRLNNDRASGKSVDGIQV